MDPGITCCLLSNREDVPNTCPEVLIRQWWCSWCIDHAEGQLRSQTDGSHTPRNSVFDRTVLDSWSSLDSSLCYSPAPGSPTISSPPWPVPKGQFVLYQGIDTVNNLRNTVQREPSPPVTSRTSTASSDSWTMVSNSAASVPSASNHQGGLPVSSNDITHSEVCPHCKRPFTNKSNLTRHIWANHELPQYCCRACGRKFGRADELKNHEKVHQTS